MVNKKSQTIIPENELILKQSSLAHRTLNSTYLEDMIVERKDLTQKKQSLEILRSECNSIDHHIENRKSYKKILDEAFFLTPGTEIYSPEIKKMQTSVKVDTKLDAFVKYKNEQLQSPINLPSKNPLILNTTAMFNRKISKNNNNYDNFRSTQNTPATLLLQQASIDNLNNISDPKKKANKLENFLSNFLAKS